MALESALSLPEHTLRTGVRTDRIQKAEVAPARLDPNLAGDEAAPSQLALPCPRTHDSARRRQAPAQRQVSS